MTHDELAADLSAHLAGNTDRMIWQNMQMGPSGSPRPDVYTIDKRYGDFHPIAYEIKVSVSDFRADVTAGKWQSYLPFAKAVWFAAPAGLLKKDDVPRECGLIVRHPTGTWRPVRRPTPQTLATLPHKVWMKLLIDGVGREYRNQPRRARNINSYQFEREHGERLGKDVCEAIKSVENARHNAKAIRERADAEMEAARQRIRDEAEKSEPRLIELRALRDELSSLLGIKLGRGGSRDSLDAYEIKAAIDELRAPVADLAKNLRYSLESMMRKLSEAEELEKTQ